MNFKEISQYLVKENGNSQEMSEITRTNLQSFGFSKINDILNEHCAQLQYLNLSYNNLSKIENLNNLVNLKELILHHNQFVEISNQLQANKQLQVLDLSHNQIEKVSNIPQLPKLQILRLNNNNLSNLQGMDSYRELQELTLSKNQFKQLNFIPALPKCLDFKINDNQLTTLSVKIFENMKNLQILDISDNKIDNLQCLEPIQQCLEKLFIGNNQVFEIPPSFRLESLDTFDAPNNKFNVLIDFDLIFPNLFTLNLANNEIFLTEDLEFITYIESLVEINLKGNICAKDEENFIYEVKTQYPFLQVINGVEINKPGYRCKIQIGEMEEEQQWYTKNFRDKLSDEDLEIDNEIQDLKAQMDNNTEEGNKELENIKFQIKQSLKQNIVPMANGSLKKMTEFKDEEEYEDFVSVCQNEFNKIKIRYQQIKEISEEQKKQDLQNQKNQKLNNLFDDDDEKNQNAKNQDNQFGNLNEYLQGDNSTNLEESNNSVSEDFYEQMMKDPKKREEIKKFEKQLEKQIIAPHETLQALKNIEKNVIIKKKISQLYSQQNQNSSSLSQTLNNNKIESVLNRQSSFQKSANQSILNEINQVKNQMSNPEFMKSLGAPLSKTQTQTYMMGTTTLKPRLPRKQPPRNFNNSVQQQQFNSKTQDLQLNSFQQRKSNASLQKKTQNYVSNTSRGGTPRRNSKGQIEINQNLNTSVQKNKNSTNSNSKIKMGGTGNEFNKKNIENQVQSSQDIENNALSSTMGNDSKTKTKLLTALKFKQI